MIEFIKNKMFKQAYLSYSYLSSIVRLILNISPFFIRDIFFKLLFKKYGKGVMIDYGVYFRYGKNISIGDHVSINYGSKIISSSNSTGNITIEDNVMIAPDVKLLAAGHDHRTITLNDTYAPIIIGKNCWICSGATILQGVKVGEGSVIAAGSVVTKNVPPFTIWGGVPAKKIRDREVYND